MDQNERMVRAEDFATRNVGGETILVPIRSGVADLECVFTLDEVGSAIWAVLEVPSSPEEVARQVFDEFDVDEGEARRDVSDFLSTMKGAGLIRPAGGSP